MSWLFTRSLAPFVALALGASLLLNLMLLVPAVFALQVFERVFASRSGQTLAMLGALVALALVLSYLMDVLRARALEQAGDVLARRLSPAALRRMFERRVVAGADEADAAGDALRDVGSLRGFLHQGLVAWLDAPWMVVHVAVIALMHPLLGAAAAAGALLLLALGALTEALTRAPSEELQQRSRATQRRAQALLQRAEAVVGLGMVAHAVEHWARAHAELLERQGALARRTQRLAALARVLQQALQAGLLALGAWLVIAHDASPGIMVAASLLLGRALAPAAQLIAGWSRFAGARAAWARLAAPQGEAAPPRMALPVPQGALAVERVVFGGSAQRAPLLRGVDLDLAPGTSLGVVGSSGSGKSTLARLLVGLWKPQAGHVRLDGVDLAGCAREPLAPYLGYLPQEVELLPGTVAENIARLGEVDAAAVSAAARLAHAHEMILRLPQGYDTPVGEGGLALSGGQRQRIALARALYGTPRLVVLDEPNAHLDTEGEAALGAALAELKARGTTVVVITHRRALLAALDRVAVLHEGRLAWVAAAPGTSAGAAAGAARPQRAVPGAAALAQEV